MGEILEARAMNERDLTARHPWVPIFYNWLVAVLLLALAMSFAGWGISVAKRNREEAIGKRAVDAYKEKQAAAAATAAPIADPYEEAFEKVAGVIARLSTEQQKKTELGVFIARYRNAEFADDFGVLADQEGQWPLYDGTDKTYDQSDWDLVDGMLRPFLDKGIVPVGLKDSFCWATWSPNDLVARNSYELTPGMETWRWQG
jgi:hypothetical protein